MPLTSPSIDLIPIRIWGSNLTIEGMELALLSVIYIIEGVKIKIQDGLAVDLLYLVEKKEEKEKKEKK